MFTDRAKFKIVAGKGGNGVVAWRREKYIPKGGPNGGNGGIGGSVIIQADVQISSLEWYRRRHLLKGENGAQGGGSLCQGKKGKDLVLKVPCGTLIKRADTGEVLKDLTEDKESVLLCKGGKGGKGNAHFKSPTRQAPNFCTEGLPGEELEIELELKIIADIGLVGFPNAGKSTLINALADVQVKIAPYPFTTLSPNIGFIQREDYTRLYIADIPGIIRDAHKDKGLGLEFLRHIHRTELLLFVLDASGVDGRNPLDDFHVLKDELSQYDANLLTRPFLVILNKMDTLESEAHFQAFMEAQPVSSEQIFPLSALTGEGTSKLLAHLKTGL